MDKDKPQPSVTCPRCFKTSYNPDDIREGYCGNCHDWTYDGLPGAQR
jgi:ribosomal protein L37E